MPNTRGKTDIDLDQYSKTGNKAKTEAPKSKVEKDTKTRQVISSAASERDSLSNIEPKQMFPEGITAPCQPGKTRNYRC